jgi:hypothetical protein
MSDSKNISDENKTKRILCYNIIKGKECQYGDKCLYAHSLEKQKIDPIRKKIYTILKGDNNLKNINLIKDKALFQTMTQLTKVCFHCSKNNCHGGYNCRNGSINPKYKICYDDVMYGNCKNKKCFSIHLTNRGMMPYYTQMEYKKKMIEITKNNSSDSSDNYDNEVPGQKGKCRSNGKNGHGKKNGYGNRGNRGNHCSSGRSGKDDNCEGLNNDGSEIILESSENEIKALRFVKSKRSLNRGLQGILLDENFLIKYYKNKKTKYSENMFIDKFSDSESDDDTMIEKMRDYLDNDSVDSLEETIFD